MKAVLWDLDGTLVDSEPAHALAFDASLAELGLTVPPDFHDRLLGASEDRVHEALIAETSVSMDRAAWRSVKWRHYRKAADQKLADAENNLGMLYLEGKGVTRDLREAFQLFERAAGQNDSWGLNNLGGMYEMGWGTPADRDKALELYRKALAAGNDAAQQNIDRLTGEAPDTAAAQ